MARLQILELPTEHHGDDMVTPYLLIIDQANEAIAHALSLNAGETDLASRVGARGILCFEETIEIPANEVEADRQVQYRVALGDKTIDPNDIRQLVKRAARGGA